MCVCVCSDPLLHFDGVPLQINVATQAAARLILGRLLVGKLHEEQHTTYTLVQS